MRKVTVATLLVLSLSPCRARASIFGEENAVLTQILVQNMAQYGELVEIVQNAVRMVSVMNETLSYTRAAYRIYDEVIHYSMDDLVNDAKTGLYRALPEAAMLEEEVQTLVRNGEAIERGDGSFFRNIDFRDEQSRRHAEAIFQHAYRSTIWPKVFPPAEVVTKSGPSQVDLLVEERLRRGGNARRVAVSRAARSVLAEKVEAFIQDGQSKNRTDISAAATNAQINLQNMSNTTDLLDLERQRAAIEENARKESIDSNQHTSEALRSSAHLLVTPGVSSPAKEAP